MHAPVCICKQICEYANKYVSESAHVYETLESMHVTDFSMLCANSNGSGKNERMLRLVVAIAGQIYVNHAANLIIIAIRKAMRRSFWQMLTAYFIVA